MSAVKTRIPNTEATALAVELVNLLRPACERIEIAGSIRRGKPDVGDIEIVMIPRFEEAQADLFTTRRVNLLDPLCADLKARGVLADRLDVNGRPSWGMKYKRALFHGFSADLFSVLDPGQWGVIFTLRTGPAEFNKRLVEKRVNGGLLPRGLFFRDGWLWQLPPPYGHELAHLAERVPTPEEADLFRVMGLDYVPPERRA